MTNEPLKLFLKTKIIRPIITLLKQGLTPQKIALSMAFGITLGIIPALGTTTVLCILAAFIFKLNMPAIQLMNFVVYPLQLLFLMPFYRAGALFFHSDKLTYSLDEILKLVNDSAFQAIVLLWHLSIHAVIVWLIFSPFLVCLLYVILLPIIKKIPFKSFNLEEGTA